MCKYCDGTYGKEIKLQKSEWGKETQPSEAQVVNFKGDIPGIVLYRNGLAQGYFDINYCPICGRELGKQGD